jgi:hypothetical protein
MELLPPPGPQRKRQLIVLGVLVVVLAIYFGRQYWPTTSAPTPASKQGTATSAKGSEPTVLPPPVKNNQLEPVPEASQATRNPFQFGAPPPPPAPPPAPVVQQPQLPPPPPPPPAPPQVPLRYTGTTIVPATKQRFALMFDPETNSSQWMLEGSVFDGRYKIVKVNADTAVVSFIDGTGQRTIFLER